MTAEASALAELLSKLLHTFFVPYLQRLAAYAVEYRQETRLECVLKHRSPVQASKQHRQTD
jgi:hypothetical protein